MTDDHALLALAERSTSSERRGAVGLELYAKLLEQDDRLHAAVFPRLRPWWRAELHRFYASHKRRFVGRVGRRGTKSSTMCRVVVAEALHGDWKVIPGEVGVVAIISVKKGDALDRLTMIRAILDALEVRYEPIDGGVRLSSLPIAFRVYAANFRTSVGFNCIALVGDEMSRWRDEEGSKNPAREVMASCRPALLTQPNGHEFCISAPFADLDHHYDLCELGDTHQQAYAWAPSWIANDTITEADCRAQEPDEATFQREYGAIPMRGGAFSFFDGNAVEAAAADYDYPLPPEPDDLLTAGGDFAFARNSSALCVACHRGQAAVVVRDGEQTLELRPVIIADSLVIKPPPNAALKPSETVREFAAKLRIWQVPGLVADGHYRESVQEHLGEQALALWDAPLDVSQPYVRTRVLMHEGHLRFRRDKTFMRNLREVTGKPTPTGRISIHLPQRADGSHADEVAAFVLAVWNRTGYRVPVHKGASLTEKIAAQEAAYIEELERQVMHADDDIGYD